MNATAESGAGVRKRSLSIAGHRTSVSLEEAFWDALHRLAKARGIAVQRLVGEIDGARGGQNLSSAIRVHILQAACAGSLNSTPAAEDRAGSSAVPAD